jgi:hypothetical protein
VLDNGTIVLPFSVQEQDWDRGARGGVADIAPGVGEARPGGLDDDKEGIQHLLGRDERGVVRPDAVPANGGGPVLERAIVVAWVFVVVRGEERCESIAAIAYVRSNPLP